MKHKKPVIGITLGYDNYDMIRAGIEYGYIRKEYGREVSAAGGEPIFLDENINPQAAAQVCDGIIISGGQDIEPIFYGQSATFAKQTEPSERTAWEQKLITACDQEGKRILGICYGHQLLNVHYGGTLYQDIKCEFGSDFDHGSSGGAVLHDVTFADNFLGFVPEQTVQVASRHHQAVRDIAPGFNVIARACDGVVEAISNGQHFGIQWHSESDGTAPQIYSMFIALCGKNSIASVSPTRILG
ncbi:MAG: gamma-glutamyl-gamma-aminobutyrate hydrolase family protein [Candidatus Saccharimonadales bacterium]